MAKNVYVYHGSPNNFDEFNLDFIGSESGTSGAGPGIYFSESEAEAFSYGENMFECVLKLNNRISNDEITFNQKFVYDLLKYMYETTEENFFENYSLQYFPGLNRANNILDKVFESCKSDTEIIGMLMNTGFSIKIMFEYLINLGYDHTVDKHETFGPVGTLHYIVYNVDSISIINKYTLDTRN